MQRWQAAAAAAMGVAVLATVVALVAETRSIERDLAARAERALAGEATSWAAVEVSGRDARLVGSAPREDLLDLAVERLDRVFGVRAVDASGAGLLPLESPYVATLTRGGQTLLVGGLAPSEPDKRRMVEAVEAALPDLAVADALSLARGMPDKDWLEAFAAAAPVAGDLANGRVVLRDRVISVDGEAASNPAYEKLRALALDLPDGYTLAPPVVVRPIAAPYRLAAVRAGDRLDLTGFAPDAESREALIQAMLGQTGPAPAAIRESVDLASGEPAGFIAAALGAVDFLDLFADVRIDIVDRRISIAGTAATPEAYRTLNSHLATFRPAGFTVEASVALPVVTPFTLTVTRAGDKVTASGFVPSAAAVEEIRRAAEQVAGPGGAVVETTLANGAPAEFTAAAVFAIRLLEHVTDGSVVIADTRVSVSGKAASSGDLLEIDASVALEAPEGFTVETAVQPPLVSPYVWSLERTEDSMVLSGYVPSEAIRVAVRDAADDAAGDLAVTDRTGLALGLPDGIDLAALAAFAATEVAKLDEGRVDLVDRTLSVTGRTADALAGRTVKEAFETALPAGLVRGTVAVDAPAPMSARIDVSAGGVAIAADVPDEAARDRVAALAGRLFGATATVSLDIVDGLPVETSDTLAEALRAASLLAEGSVAVDGGVVRIDGRALTAAAVERLDTDVVAAMPAGVLTRTEVRAPAAGPPLDRAGCDLALAEALARRPIAVGPDGVLDPDGDAAVHALAAAADACGGADLVVEAGLAAGEAPAAALARAAALADALAEAGVDRGRLATAVTGGSAGGAGLAVRAAPVSGQ